MDRYDRNQARFDHGSTSRPRPAARNSSHEHRLRRPVNKAWSGYGRVSPRVFAHGLVVSSHARYVMFMIVYDYGKPRFIERSTFHYYFLPLLEVIAERLLATCLSRTVTPDGASHSDRRPNRAAVLSSTTTTINFERSDGPRSSIDFRSAYAPAGAATSCQPLRRRAGWTGSLRSRTGAFLPHHALYERTSGTMRATFISVWLLTLYDI